MFIKRVGRRYLLLHSFRDGQGRVGHRRLGHFWDAPSLDRQLANLPQTCPELKVDVPQLRCLALDKLGADPAPGRAPGALRVEKIQRAIRSLVTLLAEEDDPEVLERVRPELDKLRVRLAGVVEEEGWVSPRRRRFDPGDSQARGYLLALDRRRKDLQQQGRWSECLQVTQQRVETCPTEESRFSLACLLQKAGRRGEAIDQYTRLSPRNPLRHYNLVAACWQENRTQEALDYLLKGLVEDPKGLWRPGYWDSFGELWTEEARRFSEFILRHPLVRVRLRTFREQRVRPRKLVADLSRVWLLERALAAAQDPSIVIKRKLERDLPGIGSTSPSPGGRLEG